MEFGQRPPEKEGAVLPHCCGAWWEQACVSPQGAVPGATLEGRFPRTWKLPGLRHRQHVTKSFPSSLCTASLEKEPPPRLGELTVTEETSSSLHLSWTVAQGPFESFVVQYRDTDGQPRAVPVAADQHTVTIEDLEPGKKYKFLLYGLVGGKRLGPVSALGMTGEAAVLGYSKPPCEGFLVHLG